jgi:hypothetical protein
MRRCIARGVQRIHEAPFSLHARENEETSWLFYDLEVDSVFISLQTQ